MKQAEPLEVELCGNELSRASACRYRDVVTRGQVPVLAMCRALIAAGYDPSRPLHVYRGKVLALTVRSIGEGARLRVNSNGVGFCWDSAACLQAQGLPSVASPSLDPSEANERMGEAAAHQGEGD
jgi:hypothetical protein